MALKQKGKYPDLEKRVNKFKEEIPIVVAEESKNHYLKGFEKGGGQTDKSASGWKKRKLKLRDFSSGRKTRLKAKRQKGRALLVDTGQLRNDIDVRKTSFNEIVIGTDATDYASFHNEGTEHLPQREIIGESRELDKKIENIIKKEISNVIFKQ